MAYLLNEIGTMREEKNKSLLILVIGDNKQAELNEKLFQAGYIPLMRNNMYKAISLLRHEQFKAIFLKDIESKMDALEFVLNVRDFYESIPVIVLGVSSKSEKYLKKLSNVHVAQEDKCIDKLHQLV